MIDLESTILLLLVGMMMISVLLVGVVPVPLVRMVMVSVLLVVVRMVMVSILLLLVRMVVVSILLLLVRMVMVSILLLLVVVRMVVMMMIVQSGDKIQRSTMLEIPVTCFQNHVVVVRQEEVPIPMDHGHLMGQLHHLGLAQEQLTSVLAIVLDLRHSRVDCLPASIQHHGNVGANGQLDSVFQDKSFVVLIRQDETADSAT